MNAPRLHRGLQIVVALALVLSVPSAVGAAPRGSRTAASVRPVGTVTQTTKVPPSCPADSACEVVTVACPEVRAKRGATVAVAAPTAPARGVVVLLSGGAGSTFWAADAPDAEAMVTDLRATGLEVVQVRWHQSWLAASSGEAAGSVKLACRPATVVKWIHDTRFVPMAVEPETAGSCGFCVSGSSGGASGTAYTLSHYGLDAYVDGAFPTSGPPHAGLAKGCMRVADEEEYWYSGPSVKQIDASYGYRRGGPCLANDAAFAPSWEADSVDLTGSDYVHPSTRVHLLVGSLDRIEPHARDYHAKLEASGTTATIEVVPEMGHDIARYPQGLDRLFELLVA